MAEYTTLYDYFMAIKNSTLGEPMSDGGFIVHPQAYKDIRQHITRSRQRALYKRKHKRVRKCLTT